MSRPTTQLLLLLILILQGCSQSPSPGLNSEQPYPPARAPEIGDILHTATGHFVNQHTLFKNLGHYALVYVGEIHDNPASHRLQLEILKSMQAHDPGKVTLGMEMFTRAQQFALDRWIAGELDEKSFLRESRWYENWGGDFELYRELMEFCREQGIPVIGLNASRELGREVSMKPLKQLDEATRTQLPEMDMNDPYQRQMIEAIFGVHGAGATMLDSFARQQTLWDETMASSVSRYMHDNPERRMLVIAGGWHINFGFGIPRRVHRRLPLPYVLVGGENLEIPEEKHQQLMDVELPNFPMRAVDFLVYQRYEVFEPRGVKLGVFLDDSDDIEAVLVIDVEADSVADKAGIQKGDRLVSIDGELLENSFDLIYALKTRRPGDMAWIELNRNGEIISLNVNFLSEDF